MHILFYFVAMFKSIVLSGMILLFGCQLLVAQTADIIYSKQTTKEYQDKEYRNLLKSINTNLSLPLTDSAEEDWQGAFSAMELINYRSAWTDGRIKQVVDSLAIRTTDFQRAFLELIYTLQINDYQSGIYKLLLQTSNSKIFAMCAEYLMLCNSSLASNREMAAIASKKLKEIKDGPNYAIVFSLLNRLADKEPGNIPKETDLTPLFATDYLNGNVIVYSIQRKNRNYPGRAIVRDKNGRFVISESGDIFSIPQLARSITNLPGYLTNGNTPQGIFRMDGFAVSQSSFIGPTENIQLTMPNEASIVHFIKNIPAADTLYLYALYAGLLPEELKNYQPLFESYQAGMAGRTEIIAHGATVNSGYYANRPYYPLIPTQGCLSAKEIWSTVDGKRIESDQQLLVNAIKAAGGADGYLIVIEIDDQQRPVGIDEILPFLNKQ
jgi:hypothetical protein